MKQTAQTKKEQLIAEAIATRRELLDVALALPEAEQDTVFLGQWTVKDVLAHLAGWDNANLEGIEAILAEPSSDVLCSLRSGLAHLQRRL